MELRFFAQGTPAPQGSKRAIVNPHTGKPAMQESSGDRLKAWRLDVRDATEKAMAETGWTRRAEPIRVVVSFRMTRPMGHYGTGRNAGQLKLSAPSHPHVRPDIDKLLRSTLDAISSAGVWASDAQVVDVHAYKVYGGYLAPTGADVTITAIGAPS